MTKDEKKIILEELGDLPEEMYDELVVEFIGLVLGKDEHMKSLLEKEDFAELANEAHFVKGASLNLRLHGIHRIAGAIERMSRELKQPEEKQVIERHLAEMVEELRELEKEFSDSSPGR